MADDESISAERVKHLELVQGVVTRQSTNSFLVKGWAITITTALLAFQANKPGLRIAAVAFLPALAFWLLDSYFLQQERLFRHLYNDIRRKEPATEPFSMDIRPYLSREKLSRVSWSITLRTFYGLLLLLTLLLFAFSVFAQK
ncbi:hypothetical protein ACIBSW_13290 [Actinoplanes sp. NPDC049668]|uniref:hypothetical protein n=1 Tax=unclassified Actinoplanes TaxID=2626549 RepID=UPI0033A6D98B